VKSDEINVGYYYMTGLNAFTAEDITGKDPINVNAKSEKIAESGKNAVAGAISKNKNLYKGASAGETLCRPTNK